MVPTHSVAVADGGGGGEIIDYTTLLDMKSVIDDNTKEQTERVLYAAMIDKERVSALIDSLVEVSSAESLANSTSTLIGENNTMMSRTNSARFYTGETAVAQFEAMGVVDEKIHTLLTNIGRINKSAVLAKIDKYNDKLLDLKKDCRLNLLKAAADKWNSEKHDLPGSPEIKTRRGENPPNPKSEWGSYEGQTIFEEGFKINNYYEEEWPASNYARQPVKVTYCKYEWHKYNIIKYWVGFKYIFQFWDPGFKEVEEMFNKAGVALPYDPSKILPKDKD